MTDDQKPEQPAKAEQPGKPPVGGPLRPEQMPPGYPDPNVPKLVFGPGSPQANPPSPQPQPPHGNNPQRPSSSATGAPVPGGNPTQPWYQGPQAGPPQSSGRQQSAPQRPQHEQSGQQQPFRPPQQYAAPQPFRPGQQPFGPGQQQPSGARQPQQFAPGQPQSGGAPVAQGQRPPQGHPSQPQAGATQVPFRPGLEYGNQAGQQSFAPAPAPKAKRKPLGRRLWIGVVIGAVAASLIAVPLTLLSVGRLFTPMLDTASVQSGVAQVLKDDFGLADVEQVECPSGQPAVTGTLFECTFSYNTKSYPVSVEVINDQGQYRVGIDAPK